MTLDIQVLYFLFMKKTLLTLPEDLLEKTKEASGATTKSEAVVIAMREYLRDKKLNRLLSRMGSGFGTSHAALLKDRAKK